MRIFTRVLLGLVALVVLAGAAFAALAYRRALPPQETVASFAPQQVAEGQRLAAAGNCAACHSRPGGAPYAGGVPLETGFGAIYSTNISPDPETGIGRWSLAAFTRSMREGVAADGTHLYPAFPYDHYTRLTDADIGALYAFVMTRQPVREEARKSELRFPFGFRPLLAGWKLLFLQEGPRPPEQGKSADWNRGAYLAEGLGHCGSCHTPRNAFGAEARAKAYDGGEAGGWWAPPLNASSPAITPWKEENLFNYLRSWDSQHGGAHGPMNEVTAALARLPESDVRALAVYFADRMSAMPDRSAKIETALRDIDPGADEQLANGKALFKGSCAVCHESNGQVPYTTQTLGQHTNLQGPDPRNAIRVILSGIPAPEERPGSIMPAFRILSDAQIADLLAYARKRYADAPPWPDVAARAAEIRKESRDAVARAPSRNNREQ